LADVTEHKLETGFLSDVSKQRVEGGYMVRAQLPESASLDFEISVEGQNLHITGTRPGNKLPSVSVIEIPDGYEAENARAICMAGSLRIIVPRE
jgi:HSP20 family molecular chaperone IbpA